MSTQNAKTVLIVNDSPEQRELMQIIFQQAGYRVLTAASGSEGFQFAASTQLEIIISDVMMPDGDGIELCRWIRADEKLHSLPILLVSGLRKDVRSVVEGLETGADDYIELPVDPLQLIARAERLIERKRMEDLLRASENHFRSVIENVSDIISIILPDGTILYQSPSLEQVLGFQPDQVIGKNIFDLVHNDDKKQVIEFFKNNMRVAATTAPIEYRFRNSGGAWLLFESVGKFIDDPSKGLIAVINSRDITERRLTEKALRESEERFKAQYKGVPLPTYTWRKTEDDFVLTDFNDAAARVTKGKIADLLGVKASRMYEDEPRIIEDFNRCFAEQTLIQREMPYRYLTTDEARQLDVSYVFVPPNIVMLHARDVTEQKQAASTLHFQKTLLQAQSEASLDGILVVNPKGEIISCNQRFVEMWGLSEDLVATRVRSNILKSGFDQVADRRGYMKIVSYLNLHPYETCQTEVLLKNGRVLDLYTAPVIDSDKVHYGRVWFFHDITERKQAEDKLRRSETNLAAAQRITHLGSWEVELSDLQRINNNRVHWSDEVYRIFGYEPGAIQVSINYYFDSIHPDDRKRCRRAFAEAVIDRKNLNIEFRVVLPNESERILHGQGEVVYDEHSGQPLTFIGTVQDITERKQIENALRQSEEKYRVLIENANDTVYTFDLSGRFTSLNRAGEQITGYTRAEALQLNIADVVSREDAERIRQRIAKNLSGEPQPNFELEIIAKNGNRVLLDISSRLIRQDGVPIGIQGIGRDITERKRAEKLIRESEMRLQALIGSIDEIVFEFDEEGTYVNIWTANENLLIRPKNELIGRRSSEFLGEEFTRPFLEIYKRVLATGQSESIEYPFDAPDGRHWFLARISPITGNETVCVLARDITARKLDESALKQSERDYRTVFEQAHDAIMVFAPECEIVLDVNQRACELYGFSRAEFIGMSIEKISKNPESGKDKVRETLAVGDSLNFETIQHRKDGSEMFLEVNASTIIYQGREAIITINRDITERKEAEAAIAEANERAIREYERLLQGLATLAQTLGIARDLNAVFSAIQEFTRVSVPCDGIFISLYEPEQNKRKMVYLWYNHEEINTSEFELLPVGDGAAGQAIKTGEVVIVDDYMEVVRRRGAKLSVGFDTDSRQPLSALVAPMKIKGNTVGIIEIQSYELAAFMKEHGTTMQMAANLAANAIENVRLLEQEREREEQLRQSQKLESVGRLAGGIAHDFNNMLTAINGYSELTLRRLKDDDPLRANIVEIKKAGERSAALTHQLLAFSRQQVLQSRVLDLNEIINDTIQMLQRLIGENIRLDTALNSKLGRVEADPGQISQVLMNLAVNARDAMPRGGNLTIETANVHLDEEYVTQHISIKPGSYVLLAVNDTGTGIDAETQQHIFEPFFTTKEIGKGTGLGLATVYGIVKQSGGYIWVYSEVGHGTSFKIYLPRIDEEVATETADSESEHAPQGAETILIVEDEDMVRALTRQILEESGYQVIEACNGVEALSICENQNRKIDLLMTDVVMPQMGGRELAEKLARVQPELRVLFTSGYTDDAVIRHNVIEADTNFIQKPFTFDALAYKVRETLDNKN